MLTLKKLKVCRKGQKGQWKMLWRPQKIDKLCQAELQTPPATSGVLSSNLSKYETTTWRRYMSPWKGWKQLLMSNNICIPVILQATFKEPVQPWNWTVADSIWCYLFYFGVSWEYFVLKKFHELGTLEEHVKDKTSEAWWSLGSWGLGKCSSIDCTSYFQFYMCSRKKKKISPVWYFSWIDGSMKL